MLVALDLTTIKDLAQILALVAAAGWLLVKALVGYFYPNLSLSLRVDRSPAMGRPGADSLTVDLTVARGKNGTVTLDGAEIRISQDGTEPTISYLDAIHRLPIGKSDGRLAVRSYDTPTTRRLNLPPEETCHLGTHATVRSDAICRVDAVVIGSKRPNVGTPGQWRATTFSVPNTRRTPSEFDA